MLKLMFEKNRFCNNYAAPESDRGVTLPGNFGFNAERVISEKLETLAVKYFAPHNVLLYPEYFSPYFNGIVHAYFTAAEAPDTF